MANFLLLIIETHITCDVQSEVTGKISLLEIVTTPMNHGNWSWSSGSRSPLLNIWQQQTYFNVSLMQVVRWDRSDVRQEMFFTPRSTHWLFNCARSVLKINYFHEWEGKWKDNGWIVLYYTAHCAGAWGSARRFQITVLSWQAIPTSEFDMHHNTSPSHNLNFNASKYTANCSVSLHLSEYNKLVCWVSVDGEVNVVLVRSPL